jgi:dipeptidyl aminopeptidase/acylaminoacyl peptidase
MNNDSLMTNSQTRRQRHRGANGKTQSSWRQRLLSHTPWVLAMCSSVAAVHNLSAQAPVIAPTENLVVESIPAIPASMADQVRKYTEARGAGLLDWHPTKKEMLISTRFGNSNQVHRVVQPLGARSQLTFFNEPIGNAIYEPNNGDYFIFSKDTGGNEFSQLYRFDMASGDVTLLTDGGRSQNGGVLWNHAKTQVVYSSTRRNGADRDIWLMDPAKPASNQLLLELQGGGWGVSDWSEDDKQLLLIERLSINQSYLWMVDVAKKTKSKVLEVRGEVAIADAKFAADGKSIYLTTDISGEFLELATLDLATKTVRSLTKDIAWDIEFFELSPDRQAMVFSANEAGVSRLYLHDCNSGTYRAIENLPNGVCGGCKWHPDGNSFAVTFTSAQSTSDIYVVQKGDVVRWTESELGGLVAKDLVEPKLVRWQSFDDKEISGFYYAPSPEKFPGKRPVIINIHGGPEGQTRPLFLGRNNYFINELGVAIIYPNVRGSAGFGKSFLKLDNGLLREDSVKDIGALLDWIAQQPDLDSSKVMVTGGSYGGYMTLAVATTYNDRITCSLDVVGISHFGTFLKNTESYRRDLRRVEYGDERDPQLATFFEKIAPLNNAAKITKPLFIVQGGNDPRVPLSEAEQMRDKVKGNQGTVWYLMAKDEGHGFRKKNNADFQFYATVLFVQQNLLGEK